MRNDRFAWKVVAVEPCLSWLYEVRQADRPTLIRIGQAITALAEEGPGLRRPLLVTIPGSRLPNLKELRPGSADSTDARLLFIFDPYRRAVFLVGGGKSAKWSDWYKTAIPQAEESYAEYLRNERKK